jgi:hypothetical protein
MSTLAFAARSTLLAAAVLAAGCSMNPMGTHTPTFGARLTGAAEVPSNASPGTGTFEARLNKDTQVLKWRVTYAGLTGPVTAAHLHGPAAPGSNAGVVVPFPGALASPIAGEATLTSAQVADLMAGRWYVNLHTAAHPGGEIRGQVNANN